jgi:hypothetical protein
MNRVHRAVFTSFAFLFACSSIETSLCAASPVAAPILAQATSAQASAAQRYVRAKDTGTKIYNLADKTSVAIGTVPAKGLLAVYGEKAGYLSVEAPGGMEVWVYGEYVRPTDQAGTLEIAGDGVLMRPLPVSDTTSYPLELRLHKGDRVRAVGRSDAKKPLAEDWVRIATPPGARGWVVATDVAQIPAGEDGAKLWNDASKAAQAKIVAYDVTGGAVAATAVAAGKTEAVNATSAKGDAAGAAAVPAAKAEGQSSAKSGDTFDAAEKLYDAARANPSAANWVEVRAAFQRYLDKNPSGASASTAKVRLEQISLHEEIARINADQTLRDSTRQDRLSDAQRRLKEVQDSQSPLWGRFQSRGWIQKEQPIPSDPPRYVVYWAGKAQAEIVCSSGRYDLAAFDQHEIGVSGVILRTAVAGSDSVGARPARIDATRIEVLASRATKPIK